MPSGRAQQPSEQSHAPLTEKSTGWTDISTDERESLRRDIGERFGWTVGPKEFQMEAIVAQIGGEDGL